MSDHALEAVHAAAGTPRRPSWAAAAWRQYRLERRMFWRNPTAAFFGVLLPLVLLALFGAVFSGTQENLDVVVPGIAGLSVASACFVALAYNLTWLRERGILKRVRGTPLSSSAYLAGIAANAVANTLIQVAVVVVAGRLLFGVSWPGDWLALIVFLVLGVVCFASLGVALSHVIPNSESAPAYVNAIFLPMMFVAGVFYDEENAPAFLQGIAEVTPLKHLIDGLSGAMVNGEGLGDHGVAVLALGMWAAAGAVLAVRGFSWASRAEG
ncbi:MAG: ABC transporter permease [Solirubrobacteraceae bacterium]